MEADKKQATYLKAKEQIQKLFETVKDGKLADIKKIIEKHAAELKEEDDKESDQSRVKNLINDTKVSTLLFSVCIYSYNQLIRTQKDEQFCILLALEEI